MAESALPYRASLQFRGELDAFLRPAQRGHAIAHAFLLPPAVKDAIEACGVPHTEVGDIRLDGRPAGFMDRLAPGADVVVLPFAPDSRLRPALPSPLRFAVDVNLGRLAQLLRLVGFDALYRNDFDDADLAALAVAGQRVLLTRDIGLLMRRQLEHGAFVHATRPEAQLLEVLRRYALARQLQPFTRCLRCNGALVQAALEEVAAQLPPRVRASATLFSQCRQCGRVYWPGTHYRRMQQFVQRIRAELDSHYG